MDIRFVQHSHFALRIVPCARTVQHERHRAVSQNRKFRGSVEEA